MLLLLLQTNVCLGTRLIIFLEPKSPIH